MAWISQAETPRENGKSRQERFELGNDLTAVWLLLGSWKSSSSFQTLFTIERERERVTIHLGILP